MKSWIPQISTIELVQQAIVFIVILTAGKLGQYLFFEWQTSPAILWPPTGIALAVIWLKGYWYAIPIFFGLFVTSLTGPVSYLIPAVFTTPFAQVLGNVIGVYLLKYSNFDGSFSKVKNIIIFLVIIVFTCMIAPTITTTISYLTSNLTVQAYISWSRSWAGYMLSCLVLFPLIVTWLQSKEEIKQRGLFERIFIPLFVLGSIYFLFWTPLTSEFAFIVFTLFFVSQFWVCFRFSEKAMTLSVFTLTVFGLLGLFLSPISDIPLNNRLFTAELFIFLVVPIIYTFFALVRERTNTVSELKNAVKNIEEENIAKNRFIAVLAHELRNPLAPVKTILEILDFQTQEPETKQLIKNAEQQVHAMRRLLDDLLDITRVAQGKIRLQIERAHLCTMIDQCTLVVDELFRERSLKLVMNPVCDDSIWLDVDPVRFVQAVVNILNNAAKYTDPHGRVEITYVVQDGVMELMIRDNGIGIEERNLDNIFIPFWQRDSRSQRPEMVNSGIGVGLSLTKHIVELHGGKISAMSEGLGKGSTFTITLPISKNAEYRKDPLVVKDSELISPFRILIVDDNRAATEALAKLLTLKGHQVEKAFEGKEVFKIVHEFDPEVIVLDIGLPDMNGYEVVRRLRAQGFTNTIFALSGYGQQEDKDKAKQAGFSHHITKPMRIELFEGYLSALQKTKIENENNSII